MAIWPGWVSLVKQAADAVVGFIVQRSSSSGSANLQEWQDESGTVLASVGSDGGINAKSSATVTMKSDSTIGLIVKRFSSNQVQELMQWQDETGTRLGGISNQGKLSVINGIDVQKDAFNRSEFSLLSGDINTTFNIWNAGGGVYNLKATSSQLQINAVQFGVLNPANSLSDVRLMGRQTTPGIPTSNTWSTNDAIIDSVGGLHLCTSGGTPGTWIGGGWQLAGFWKAGSALQTSGAITVSAFDELMIVVRIVSMSAATDTPNLRFNGDTGTNYRARYISVATGTSTTLVNTPTASGTSVPLTPLAVSTSQVITAVVNNRLGTAKIGIPAVATGIGSASGTQPGLVLGGNFEWVNTSAQITSVELRSSGGSVTFAADSGFQVFGRNFA